MAQGTETCALIRKESMFEAFAIQPAVETQAQNGDVTCEAFDTLAAALFCRYAVNVSRKGVGISDKWVSVVPGKGVCGNFAF
jgi:hypothetical protein